MKYISFLLLVLMVGCGGRTDGTASSSAPPASVQPIAYKTYTLNLHDPQDPTGDKWGVITGLTNSSFLSVSFDLSTPIKEIRAAETANLPATPPDGPRQPKTVGGLYPDRPYGQFMFEIFHGLAWEAPACTKDAMAARTSQFKKYPYQTVRLGKVRLDVPTQSSDAFRRDAVLCYATHSGAGWKWHIGPQVFVTDSPGSFGHDGAGHVEFLVNEEGVDQIVIMAGSLGAGFPDMDRITYEAVPYP